MQKILTHIEALLQVEAKKSGQNLHPQQIPISDQQRILNTDIREVITGGTIVFDDREPRQR
jgi:hypothetical protein